MTLLNTGIYFHRIYIKFLHLNLKPDSDRVIILHKAKKGIVWYVSAISICKPEMIIFLTKKKKIGILLLALGPVL